MQPRQLTAGSFAGYPPEARALATEHVELLRELPLVLVPILLRELIAYDWKLPAERRELEKQISFLTKLTASERASTLKDFGSLQLTSELGGGGLG